MIDWLLKSVNGLFGDAIKPEADEPQSPRFCKDCCYFEERKIGIDMDFSRCNHPSAIDVVTGQPGYCGVERSGMSRNRCGRDGRHFKEW